MTSTRPAPGSCANPVPTGVDGTYPGREQHIRLGSYVIVDDRDGVIAELDAFTLTAWVFPTARATTSCGLVTQWSDADAAGFGLLLDVDGRVELHVADGHRADVVQLDRPLPMSTWSFVAATLDALWPCRHRPLPPVGEPRRARMELHRGRCPHISQGAPRTRPARRVTPGRNR